MKKFFAGLACFFLVFGCGVSRSSDSSTKEEQPSDVGFREDVKVDLSIGQSVDYSRDFVGRFIAQSATGGKYWERGACYEFGKYQLVALLHNHYSSNPDKNLKQKIETTSKQIKIFDDFCQGTNDVAPAKLKERAIFLRDSIWQ